MTGGIHYTIMPEVDIFTICFVFPDVFLEIVVSWAKDLFGLLNVVSFALPISQVALPTDEKRHNRMENMQAPGGVQTLGKSEFHSYFFHFLSVVQQLAAQREVCSNSCHPLQPRTKNDPQPFLMG